MRSLLKILLKFGQMVAWVLALLTVPVFSALWVICSVSLVIIFQLLVVLHPSLGRKFDAMFQELFLNKLFND